MATEWHTGPYPQGVRAEIDHGRYQYTHMIRAPGDPERLSREERRRIHGPGVVTKWRKMHKRPVAEFREEILAHMADGKERTFNRIAVELYDYTADVAGPAITKAIFDLVEERELEHTMGAPIYFRKRRPRAKRARWLPGVEPEVEVEVEPELPRVPVKLRKARAPGAKVAAPKAKKPTRKRKRKAKPKPAAAPPPARAPGFAEAVRASKGRREISPFEAAGKRRKKNPDPDKTARQQRIMAAFERST